MNKTSVQVTIKNYPPSKVYPDATVNFFLDSLENFIENPEQAREILSVCLKKLKNENY